MYYAKDKKRTTPKREMYYAKGRNVLRQRQKCITTKTENSRPLRQRQKCTMPKREMIYAKNRNVYTKDRNVLRNRQKCITHQTEMYNAKDRVKETK